MRSIASLLIVFAAAICRGADFPVPDGYELQMLEPLGGKVAKPKGWHYKGGMTPVGFDWVISKEATDNYETGLQIQGFVKVKEGTGKTPREFAIDGLKEKERGATVFRRWPETQVGYFLRRGIEIEEFHERGGKKISYHVIYTALTNDAWGMAVFTIFGAPSSEWKDAEPISGIMSRIELIDMSRFETPKGANQSPEPTPAAGTSAAEQPLVPAAVVAHL